MSGAPAPSMNLDLQDEISHRGSAPSDALDLLLSANRTGSASTTSAETKSPGMETMVPKEESEEQAKEQEHNRQPPTEDVSIPPPPPASHEPSVGASSPHHSNPFSNMAPPPAPSISAPLSDLPTSSKFYSFVILHVPEDREEAMRACEILHGLEIGEGTTFCEGFETAGVSPLRCLEDAVENSAYIVLLLTSGFLSKWGEFQTNTVLMNSIEDGNKSGSVIPFIPESRPPVGKIPLAVRALIPLYEASGLFQTRVRNTFKRETIQRQRERWIREQELQALQRSVEDARELAGDLEMRQRIAMDHQAVYNDLCAHLSSIMSILPPQLIPGHGPVNIQISNASNVQIGNQNSMNVQEIPPVPAQGDQDAHTQSMH